MVYRWGCKVGGCQQPRLSWDKTATFDAELTGIPCTLPKCAVGIPAAVLEAVQAHTFGDSNAIQSPTALETLAKDPAYQGGVWMLVDIDLSKIDTSPVRLNISLPSNLVHEIDAWVKDHRMTRSGFLAQAAERAMR